MQHLNKNSTDIIAKLDKDTLKLLQVNLQMHMDAGVDELIGSLASDFFIHTQQASTTNNFVSQGLSSPLESQQIMPSDLPENAITSEQLAMGCHSLEDLYNAVAGFGGCALKDTATSLVFGAGNPNADLMVIGEAPGADEDRQGKPFVGVDGQLLDRMLQAIGQTRESFYVTNVLYWRPPGNRTPTDGEIAACLPFLQRQIELVAPKVLLLVGGRAAKSLLNQNAGITKLHGKWFEYTTKDRKSIPAISIFHPAYLLRTPEHKRFAWQDLCALATFMQSNKFG